MLSNMLEIKIVRASLTTSSLPLSYTNYHSNALYSCFPHILTLEYIISPSIHTNQLWFNLSEWQQANCKSMVQLRLSCGSITTDGSHDRYMCLLQMNNTNTYDYSAYSERFRYLSFRLINVEIFKLGILQWPFLWVGNCHVTKTIKLVHLFLAALCCRS